MSGKKVNDQAKTNFKFIGGALVFFGLLGVLMVWVITGKSQKTESVVTSMQHPDRASETEHSPRYTETVRKGNEQRRQEALKTGQAAIPTITGGTDRGTDPGFPKDPLNVAAAVPPTPPPTTTTRNETDEKDRQKKMIIDHLIENEWGKKAPDQAVVFASTKKEGKESGGEKSSGGEKGGSPAQTGQEKKEGTIAIDKGTLCYGIIRSPIDTDSPGRIMGELIHCPGKTQDFSGAKIYGTFERQNNVVAVKIDLMNHHGVGYAITALALDEKTSSGVLSGEVDHHIFTRYWVPVLSEFVAGWGSAAARGNTNVTVSLGGTTQTQGELSTKNQLLVASGQGAKTVNQIAQEAIKGREITVKKEGNTTIGIVFLEAVQDKK